MNKRLLLNKRPQGVPAEDTWELETQKVPVPGEGEFLVKQYYVSLDPAMRGWMNDRKSYIPPIGLGEVMRAGSIGKIITSNHPAFEAGDFVSGMGGVQQYAISNGKGWVKVPGLSPIFLGTLGMPGFTAYFGLLDVGALKEGDTVLVSGAAGAVGSVVGQIAKLKGNKVVGIAGGPEKCNYIKETLGFDDAIDYKSENVWKRMKETCPEGVDVYFDNVGGDILNAALACINFKARVVICGAISQYNSTEVLGPPNYLSLLVNRARMEGFIVFDYAREYAKAAQELGEWVQEGKIKSKEFVAEGIENFRETFLRLFSGDKLGKLVLQINELDP